VTLRGVPAVRFWTFEDHAVVTDRSSVGPTDLARLLLAEYAASYGNDWFVIPLTLPVGAVSRVESLVVTDSFGVRSLLRPIGDRALPNHEWGMWQLDFIRRPGGEAASVAVSNRFFIPPTATVILESRPIEEVYFARDEMANVAWALERKVEGSLGAGIDVRAGAKGAPASQPEPGQTGAGDAERFYQLASAVPAEWIPLLPAQSRDSGRVVGMLRRGRMLSIEGEPHLNQAQSRALNEQERLAIFDEEVPRDGLTLTRRRRIARWVDGTTWLWQGYRKQVGRGGISSGLIYDELRAGAPPL
jgi:hypothetical protein